jgi:hypothetical protein
MKYTKLALISAIALGAIASSASAAQFLFTYSGDMGINGAFGSLTGTANGDGTYTATSGTITEFGPVATGTGALIANPSAPASHGSPTGFFTYDDQLLPGQNPLISNGGLLFSVGGVEINIFSNGAGPDTYTIYNNRGTQGNGDFALSQLAGVPEPATWGLMLVGFGGLGAMLRRRRGQIALTA